MMLEKMRLLLEKDSQQFITWLKSNLKKIDINDPSEKTQNTFLHIAAEKGDAETVDLLLSLNADKNAKNKNEETPFFLAVKKIQFDVVHRLLREPDLEVDTYNTWGLTPLNFAAEKNPKLLTLLIDHCAIDLPNLKTGATPLIHAACRLSYINTLLLLRSGANVNAKNKDGKTAFDLVLQKEIKNKEFKNLELLNLLLFWGAEIPKHLPNNEALQNLINSYQKIRNEKSITKTLQFFNQHRGHDTFPSLKQIAALTIIQKKLLSNFTLQNLNDDIRDFLHTALPKNLQAGLNFTEQKPSLLDPSIKINKQEDEGIIHERNTISFT